MSKSVKIRSTIIVGEVGSIQEIEIAFRSHFTDIINVVEQLRLKYINVTTTIDEMSNKQVQMHIDIDEVSRS